MKAIFKQASVEDILNLRHKVLRTGRPISSAHFDGDEIDSTYHFACYYESKIAGCLSLMNKRHEGFSENNQYQLRGMAVDENFRGLNLGKQLLNFAEEKLKSSNNLLIWCNVRVTAKTFYSKNNYSETGQIFEIPNVGLHILMYKKL